MLNEFVETFFKVRDAVLEYSTVMSNSELLLDIAEGSSLDEIHEAYWEACKEEQEEQW